jgi:hypothetical protein
MVSTSVSLSRVVFMSLKASVTNSELSVQFEGEVEVDAV